MPSTPFGEHLRREREMRGVSLEEVAAATRISTRFLQAIENEQWERLPGGVFNRGFLRSIARFLGLDEDSLVAEYELGVEDHIETHSAPPATSKIPRDWLSPVATVAVLLIIAAGGVFAYHHFGRAIAVHLHKTFADAVTSVTRQTSAPGSDATQATTKPPVSSAVHDPTPARAAGVPSAADLKLKIEAGKPADIRVVADHKTVFEGHVQRNYVRQFQANKSFTISTSESSALLLELNGQMMGPIGTPGKPGTIVLTRSDLTAPAGDSH